RHHNRSGRGAPGNAAAEPTECCAKALQVFELESIYWYIPRAHGASTRMQWQNETAVARPPCTANGFTRFQNRGQIESTDAQTHYRLEHISKRIKQQTY